MFELFEILVGINPATVQAQTGRKAGGVRRGLLASSRSAEDLLSSPRLRLSKSTVTLGEVPAQVRPQVTTCAEYSEVWDPGDSGISSTSDSTVSYSIKTGEQELEDLSKVPWYESEMPR